MSHKGVSHKGVSHGNVSQRSVGVNSYAVGRNAQSRPSPGQDRYMCANLFRRRSKLGVCAPQRRNLHPCLSSAPILPRSLTCPDPRSALSRPPSVTSIRKMPPSSRLSSPKAPSSRFFQTPLGAESTCSSAINNPRDKKSACGLNLSQGGRRLRWKRIRKGGHAHSYLRMTLMKSSCTDVQYVNILL